MKKEPCLIWKFANFFRFNGAFTNHDYIVSRGIMDGKAWWMIYKASFSHLQSLAFKLLAQPYSSSCCEEIWVYILSPIH